MRPLLSSVRSRRTTVPLLIALAFGLAQPSQAQPAATSGLRGGGGTEGVPGDANAKHYQLPPQTLVDIIDRPLTPGVRISPDQRWLLLLEQPNMPSIAELAETELRLGGLRFKPRNNSPSRRRPASGLALLQIDDRSTRAVTGLPDGARLDDVRFSPDGSHIAFTHTSNDRVELWVAEVATARARRLTALPLNLSARVRPAWLADSRALVCAAVPEGRGPAPEQPRVPSGPTIQENLGSKAPARTYQDLLANAHDEALFEHYLTSQLVRISLEGEVETLGEPAVLWHYDPSPDGEYLLVEILHRPFSYLRPARWFPTRIEVWDSEGELVKQLADLPLRENIPIARGSVAEGPRRFSWRHDASATLVWVEALDGGDAGREAELRDRLYLLAAPFDATPVVWAALKNRYGGIYWGRDDLALVSGWWWKTRNIRVSRIRPGAPERAPELLIDRSWEDRYHDPGDPLTTTNDKGRQVLLTGAGGQTLLLIGNGASEEGDRPFLDLYDLETGESRRLFRSEAPYYERPFRPLDAEGKRLLTRRESVAEPPNYYVRDLGVHDLGVRDLGVRDLGARDLDDPDSRSGEAALEQLTFFPHPTPELIGIQKEQIRYPREDGLQLTATLYLPPGYSPEHGPLPMLMWAYPQEFKSAAAAGQVSDSPYRFDRIGWWSSLLWLTQGYAVLDDPSMPIVGEGDEEPNDTFRRQLVASARAAVDESLRRRVTSAGQIAIGGHSYGAFMTANLLAHSDLFAAGIARSGAYNRTLTPFGFQSEERTLWQAPEIYFDMSPFMHAEKVNEPILLIHGEVDNNSGTFPMQSERYYNALRGHGATARLVMLPHESHGYRARESVLHMLWETHRWLETYVRKPAVREERVPVVERGEGSIGGDRR